MTLGRIVTRLAVIEALTNFNTAPYPTIADGEIFDSKIEPSEGMEGEHPVPVAVVYTDYDKDFMVYRNKLQTKRLMTITIEFLVVQASQILDEAKNPTGMYSIDTPFTDSELEMSLDIFEGQAFASLAAGGPAGDCFTYLVQGYENVISRRGAAVTAGQRLSARQVTIECDILRDPMPGNLPEPIRTFLDAVIERDEHVYGTRAAALKQLYLDDLGLSAEDKVRRVMNLSRPLGTRLGYSVGLTSPLGTPVVFLDPQGRPA